MAGKRHTESPFMVFEIDTTLERDIDLLIMEEFVSLLSFAKIFANKQTTKGDIPWK